MNDDKIKPKDFKIILNNFVNYVHKRDEVSVVLKAHLFLEQVIDILLEDTLTNPEPVLQETFYKKINILYATGVITNELKEKLLFVNSIRNKFSHEFSYSLSSEDIKKLSILVGPKVEVPKSFIIFPKAKESFMYSSVVCNLVTLLLLLKGQNGLHKKIMMESIDSVLKKFSA